MNLEYYWDNKALESHKNKIKKIFFYRICGMGMGACANLMKEAGFSVEGADSVYFPPMSLYLEESQIPCFDLKEVDGDFLKKYDLIVVGNSVGGRSDEARMLEEVGVPFTSFPTLLGEMILKEKNVIGIAGTHGKTTTTYYMTQMLDRLGKKPGHFVGGVLLDRSPSTVGDGDYFVIESDEYDSSYFQKFAKFRQYYIDNLVLTSLEYDHADIYENIEAIEKEFHAILDGVSSFIGNSDYQPVKNIAEVYLGKRDSNKVQFYGFDSDFGPKNISYQDGKCNFELTYKNEKLPFTTSVIGDHNILNLSSCILFCLKEGFDIKSIQSAVLDLKNVKRRQEYRGLYKGAIVVDDFAHHPTSIELTIDAIKNKYPGKKVHAVIEPSTSTNRSNAFKDTFAASFKGVESVIVANPKIPTNAKQFEDLDYQGLAEDIKAKLHIDANMVENLQDLRGAIDDVCENDCVLLVMGNRTILGLWQSDFVSQLT